MIILRIFILTLLMLIIKNSLSQGVIDLDSSEYVFIQGEGEVKGSVNDINNKDFIILLSMLDYAVQEHNNFPMNGEIIGKYYIQIKWIDESKKGKVKINGLCSLSDEERKIWNKELIEVVGGGSCYFNLTVDLTEERYYDFRVN
jgi:hypothetical protein